MKAEVQLRRIPKRRSSQNSILLEEAVVDCGCMKCPQCLRRKGRCFPIERGHLLQLKEVLDEEGLACVWRERSAGTAARLCGFSAKLWEKLWRSHERKPHGEC